jgi:hypothetical protein
MMNWGAVLPHDYPEADTQAAEAAERIEAAFRERLRFTDVHGDWQVASGKVSETVVCQARHADLVILGQVDPTQPPAPAGRQLVEDVLMTSGRPILTLAALRLAAPTFWSAGITAVRRRERSTTRFLFSLRPHRSPF